MTAIPATSEPTSPRRSTTTSSRGVRTSPSRPAAGRGRDPGRLVERQLQGRPGHPGGWEGRRGSARSSPGSTSPARSSPATTRRSTPGRRPRPRLRPRVSRATAATRSTSGSRPAGSCRSRPACRRARRWRSARPGSPRPCPWSRSRNGAPAGRGPGARHRSVRRGRGHGPGDPGRSRLRGLGRDRQGGRSRAAPFARSGRDPVARRGDRRGPAARHGTMGRRRRRRRRRDAALRAADPAGRRRGRGVRATPAARSLETTVFPFILRGVALLGMDSVPVPIARRREIWDRLATDLRPRELGRHVTEVGLEELDGALDAIVAGSARGRWVVRIGG